MSVLSVMVVIVLLGLGGYWLGRRRGAPAMQGGSLRLRRPAESARCFTLGVYNIHRARGSDGKKSLARIAGVIKGVDLLGLCECEGAAIWGGSNQCDTLGEILGMTALFSPTQKRWGRYDRGNGLLSRLPVTSWRQFPLKDSTGTHPRTLLRADLDIDGQLIPVFVTHLSRRIDQAAQLETVLAEFRQHPRAMLVGDFNLISASTLLAEFLESDDSCDAIAQTLESDDAERIDWIFTRGIRVLDGGSSPLGPSDHPFYWVRLEI